MEPISFVVAAIMAGVVAAARPVAEKAVKDAYEGVKRLIIDKYQERKNLATAWQGVENDVENELWQQMLEKELKEAGVEEDSAVLERVQALNELLVNLDPQAYGDINVDLEKMKATGNILVESDAAGGGQVKVKGREWESGGDIKVSSKTNPKAKPPA